MFDGTFTLRCGATLPGRLALAPMTNTQSEADGTLSQAELSWLRARAAGGFPIVSTCAAYVHPQGQAWPGQLGIADARHLEGLTKLAGALREQGAFSIVQLHHGGKAAELATDRISADASEGTRAATPEDLDEVVAAFARAAARAEQAGFDGIEIHGANGYLLTQFLAPEDNHRTDAYGGSLENRARLTLAVIDAVRAAVRPGFAVGIRLSPVDAWSQRGLVLQEGLQVARWVTERPVDFVHLSLGDAAGPPPHEPGGPVVARAMRDVLPREVPIFAAGGIRDHATAQRAFAAGVDVVAVARTAIRHPDFPRLAADPAWSPVAPPWSEADLREAVVGEAMITYLKKFPGLVEGGRSGR